MKAICKYLQVAIFITGKIATFSRNRSHFPKKQISLPLPEHTVPPFQISFSRKDLQQVCSKIFFHKIIPILADILVGQGGFSEMLFVTY
ncbi:MAG: hypothetical protein R2830_04710 [Saprospiraceae bacterium]